MNVQVAIQTLIWGTEIGGVERMLDEAKDAGYDGVEFAQPPETLGEPEEVAAMLRDRGLVLLGMAGGSLRSRVDFCQRAGLDPLYVYVQDLTDSPEAARSVGYTLALHPHSYTPIDRFSKCQQPLHEHDDLMFLPDTAHLWLAGDDVVDVLKATADRTVGVHLKDWRPDYGRSFATYASFCCGKRDFTRYVPYV